MSYPTTIVLTGASRGIGFETAKLLLPKGCKILSVARNPTSIERAMKNLSPLGKITFIQGDVKNKETAQEAAAWVKREWGSLDCLINNAGIQIYKPSFLEEDLDVLENTLQVNVLGAHYFIKALLPFLYKGDHPRIINVSSGVGTREATFTNGDMPSYRISKYTLNAVTKAYSQALEGKIAINSFDPGWLKTDLGGPNAPGEPIDGAHRLIQVINKDFKITGKFFHGEIEISF